MIYGEDNRTRAVKSIAPRVQDSPLESLETLPISTWYRPSVPPGISEIIYDCRYDLKADLGPEYVN